MNVRKKHSISVKTLGVVIDKLKQKNEAISAKVKRYEERVDRFSKIECFRIIRDSFMGN